VTALATVGVTGWPGRAVGLCSLRCLPSDGPGVLAAREVCRTLRGSAPHATELVAASRSTINAHYTSAEVVVERWRAFSALGFSGGRVLEPGREPLHLASLVPDELWRRRTSSASSSTPPPRRAAALDPEAEVRAESFADTRLPEASSDLAIGNVPSLSEEEQAAGCVSGRAPPALWPSHRLGTVRRGHGCAGKDGRDEGASGAGG